MMKVDYLEIDGKRLPLPPGYEIQEDPNQEVVSRTTEKIEQIETAEVTCVALGNASSFAAD
jgi:hypothetical protein